MNCYRKYKKLRLYVDGVAVEPAQYAKGETYEYVPADSILDCRNYDKVPRFRNVEGYVCELQPEFKDVDGYICEPFTPTKIYDASEMFSGRTDITSTDELELWRYDFSECSKAKNMFAGCENLRIANLSGFASAGFDVLGSLYLTNMFYNCTNLEEVYLPDLPTNQYYTTVQLKYMFSNCRNLKIINLGNIRYLSNTRGDYMFSNCRSLSEITCTYSMYDAYASNLNNVRGVGTSTNPRPAFITWHYTDR